MIAVIRTTSIPKYPNSGVKNDFRFRPNPRKIIATGITDLIIHLPPDSNFTVKFANIAPRISAIVLAPISKNVRCSLNK